MPEKNPPPGVESRPAQSFLKVLAKYPDEWLTRTNIRDNVGAHTFTAYYGQALESLVEAGLVERRNSHRGVFQRVYTYRITPEGLAHVK